jgi:membrane associated rhomboid family serine protease
VEYVRVLLDAMPQRFSPAELVQQLTAYDLVVFDYGFRPVAPDPTALFTSMFLHAGFMHLAGNMLFLWIYGDNVEHRLGSVRFLAAYLATGVAATAFHTAFSLDSALPVVGASGAISGVLGFYFVWFPHNRVRVWVFLFPFIMNVFKFRARLVLGVYLFIDNVMPFLIAQGTGGGGVAYGAHIGGFVAGLGWAWWAGQREVATAPTEYRRASRAPAASSTSSIGELVAEGRFAEGAPVYFRLRSDQTRRLLAPGASIAFGDWLARNGHPEAALVVYQRHLRDYQLGPMSAEAHLGAGLVQLQALGRAAPAYQHLVEVFDHDPTPETRAVARQALDEIAARQKFKVAARSGRSVR